MYIVSKYTVAPNHHSYKHTKYYFVSVGVVYHRFVYHIYYEHVPLMLHQCKIHTIMTAFICSTSSIFLAFQTEQTFCKMLGFFCLSLQ